MKKEKTDLNERFLRACEKGYFTEIEGLLRSGADPSYCNDDGETGLMLALKKGNTNCLEKMLALGVKDDRTSKTGWSALHFGVYFGQARSVEMLVKAGVTDLELRVKRSGKSPLEMALDNMKDETTLTLLALGASTRSKNQAGQNALMLAAMHDQDQIVKWILEKGEDPNDSDNQGWSPLMYAGLSDQVNSMRVLLMDDRTKVNWVNDMGMTSLMIALEDGNIECSDLLLEKGADVGLASNNGKKGIHYLASLEMTGEDVKSLLVKMLKAGAEINATDDEGKTPLMIAVSYGNEKMTLELLKAGADIRMKDDSGQSAMDKIPLGADGIKEILIAWMERDVFEKESRNGELRGMKRI